MIALTLAAGCSLIPLSARRPGSSATAGTPGRMEDAYQDYVGVIHVHTTYSHDAHGTFEDVVRVANAQRLNYVVLTEHNTLQPLREGRQGWHGTTLVLVGVEISTRAGHYLALNVTEEIDRTKLTTQQVIDEVNRQGGFGFIAHPYFKNGRWRDWTVTGMAGIEGYNVAHDTLDENALRLVLWTLATPAEPFYLSILDRPYDPLAKWDELIRRHGRMVGIGSVDAHEFHVFGLKFAPYEDMFQIVRTHVLVPSTTLTPERFYEALRAGHAYFSIELVTEAKGFSFLAARGTTVVGVMGDELPWAPGLRLQVWVPATARLTLFKDGVIAASTIGRQWVVPVEKPGVYRIEAERQGKPWIFSNPIYIRPEPPPSREAPNPTVEVGPKPTGEPPPSSPPAQPASGEPAPPTRAPPSGSPPAAPSAASPTAPPPQESMSSAPLPALSKEAPPPASTPPSSEISKRPSSADDQQPAATNP